MKSRKPRSLLKKTLIGGGAVLALVGVAATSLPASGIPSEVSLLMNEDIRFALGYLKDPKYHFWKATLPARTITQLEKELLNAVEEGEVWKVEPLMEVGKEKISERVKQDALVLAVTGKDDYMVDELLRLGISPKNDPESRALAQSVALRNVFVTEMLLSAGANLFVRNGFILKMVERSRDPEMIALFETYEMPAASRMPSPQRPAP